MDYIFPRHPCVLARPSNPFKCAWPHDPQQDTCAVCRAAMRDDAWRALMEGDRSFAEFVLADDLLVRSGFRVDDYQGEESRDPVFGLVRSAKPLPVESGDCVIVPLPGGTYHVDFCIDDETDYRAECADLAQAWLLVHPLLQQAAHCMPSPALCEGNDVPSAQNRS